MGLIIRNHLEKKRRKNNMSKPLTYYINAEETLHKVSGGVAIYKYSKQYTFHEGDNGTINFNTLP